MSDILTPNFGESVTSATVAAWHKNAGDPVAKGDTLVTLETDKVPRIWRWMKAACWKSSSRKGRKPPSARF